MSKTLPWFRMYSEAIDDYKLKLLAFEDRWHFVGLLCCKCQGILDQCEGDMLRRAVAVKLGLDMRELDEVARRLSEVDLIEQETLQPMAWDERQMRSDNSAERVQKYRQKRAKSGLPKSSEVPARMLAGLKERDGGACVYCGSKENLCVDHMVPIVQGGTDDPLNLCVACKSCNSGKAGRTPDQAGYKIRNSVTEQCLNQYIERVTVTVTAQEVDTDIDIDTEIKKEQTRKPQKRGSRLPADWLPGQDLLAWAMTERADLNMQRVIDSFRDYWQAKTGASATKRDWDATFRNWVRNEKNGNGSGARGGSIGRETLFERSQRQGREALQRLDDNIRQRQAGGRIDPTVVADG